MTRAGFILNAFDAKTQVINRLKKIMQLMQRELMKTIWIKVK